MLSHHCIEWYDGPCLPSLHYRGEVEGSDFQGFHELYGELESTLVTRDPVFLHYPSKVIESTEQILLNGCLTWVGYNFIEERISLHLKFPEDRREGISTFTSKVVQEALQLDFPQRSLELKT